MNSAVRPAVGDHSQWYTPLVPHIDKHPPGAFCWIELATTDQNAAKSFYGSLFGWAVKDVPMGPNDFYSMFQLDGRDAAAAYTCGRNSGPKACRRIG